MLKDFLEGKPLGHPIHPMLVHFPIGLFLLSFLLDLASLAFPSVPSLVRDSFYAMLLGLIMALVAGPCRVSWITPTFAAIIRGNARRRHT